MDLEEIWNKFGSLIYIQFKHILLIMTVLDINTMKQIIENVPEDYEILFTSGKNVFKFDDKFEIDVSEKKIIFKKY